MAFGGFGRGGGQAPMAEINMIPLIDVMLVLLVIFIITAPLLTHAVKVDLPKASSSPNRTKPDNVQLAIDDAGAVYWNGVVLERRAWRERMEEAAAQRPQPEGIAEDVGVDRDVADQRVLRALLDHLLELVDQHVAELASRVLPVNHLR